MEEISLGDAIDRDIGKIGTPDRDAFEAEVDEEIYGNIQPLVFMIESLRSQGLGVKEIIERLKKSFDGLENVKHKVC